jgi:hypothetical protein
MSSFPILYPSNFTGLRPAGSGANNIWIKFYVGPTAMYIPAWYG